MFEVLANQGYVISGEKESIEQEKLAKQIHYWLLRKAAKSFYRMNVNDRNAQIDLDIAYSIKGNHCIL